MASDLSFNLDSGMEPGEIFSWAIPKLSFFQINNKSKSSIGRSNEMEKMLTALHTQSANVAYLLLGGKAGYNCYFGSSIPVETESGETIFVGLDRCNPIFDNLSGRLGVADEALNADKISSMIEPISKYVGCVSGIPANGKTCGEVLDSLQIEHIVSGLAGLSFGILVLAAPVTPGRVALEEARLMDEIGNKRENDSSEAKRRAKYFVEFQKVHLQDLLLGAPRGIWQVGVYYFAGDRSVFVRLQSLLRATYVDITIKQAPLRIHEMDNLGYHLKRFGLLKTPGPNLIKPGLHRYYFLTPLDSQRLSVYVNVPARL